MLGALGVEAALAGTNGAALLLGFHAAAPAFKLDPDILT